MRICFLLFIFIITTSAISPQEPDSTGIFICPPCGMSCDLLTFNQPGICHVCHMQLIVKEDFQEHNAGIFQSLKEQGILYLLIWIGTFQGLMLTIFLIFSKRANRKKSNRFLALLVFSVTIGCVYYLILEYRLIYQYYWISFFPMKLFYVYGTSLYLYVSVSLGHTLSKSIQLAHFTPALVTAGLGFLFLSIGISPNSFWFGQYNLFIIDIAGSMHSIVYFILSFRMIRTYNKQIQHYVADDQQKLDWLQRLVSFLISFFSIWVLYLIYSFIEPGHVLNNYMFIFWIIAGVLIYWIGYRGLVQPELFSLPDKRITALTPEKHHDLNPYVEALENAMTASKLYLNPTLTRQDVASHIKITPNQLSYMLNTLIGKSFYDFVNEYRVTEVMARIENPDNSHLTLEGIAYESGFNSKSTFNAIFKKNKGITPRQYRSSITQKDPKQ